MFDPKSNWYRPISAQDFAQTLINQRPELKLDKSNSQSAARIQMMSDYMSKACETLPCSSNFHATFFAPLAFILIALFFFR